MFCFFIIIFVWVGVVVNELCYCCCVVLIDKIILWWGVCEGGYLCYLHVHATPGSSMYYHERWNYIMNVLSNDHDKFVNGASHGC